VKEVLPRDDIE